MQESEIKVDKTYTSKRWKGDRKVKALVRQKDLVVVHYIDLRTLRTGNSPLELFAGNADGFGLLSPICKR